MANPSREHLEKTLSALFDAERTARKLHDELEDAPQDVILEVLTSAIEAAQKEVHEQESSMRLSRVATVLGAFHGPRVVDILIDILGSEAEEARDAAADALHCVAYERFKEVAQGVERALSRLPVGSPALQLLPDVLSEIPEPGVSKLLAAFLAHEDPEAVASALQVAVEMGDGSLARHVKKLIGDKRIAEVSNEDEEHSESVTLGELAEEALEVLQVIEGDGRGKDDA